MQYLMLIYHDDAKMAALSPKDQEAIGVAYGEFNAFLSESGASRGTATWPANITTVLSRDGKTVAREGSHQTGNGVAGFFLIEVGDLATATQFAERVPIGNFGAVEIRPVQQP
jgi:hypothetical protein